MKFKKSSIPSPSVGTDYSNVVDQVVPDQNMSLHEILTRFTRGEVLPVGKDVNDGVQEESDTHFLANVDLEKLATSDLVDKEEFVNKLRSIQQEYDKQQAEKAAALKAKQKEEFAKADAKRIRMAAKKLAAKQNPEKLA